MATRRVRFDFFEVYCRRHDKKKNFMYDHRFDLGPILLNAERLDVMQRSYEVGDEEARLQNIEKLLTISKGHHLWGMQFVRVRKNDRPGIVKDDGTFDYLNLEDNEYIGEEVAVLYDSELRVIMIQRNKDSLAPPGIQLFFNKAWQDDEIRFRAIITPDVLKSIQNKQIRGLTIKLANLREGTLRKKGVIKIIQGISAYNAVNAEISLSIGRKRMDDGLDEEEIMQTIKGLRDASEVTKLEVKVVEDDLTIRPYDLIEDRLHEWKTFSYSKEEIINYERVIPSMLAVYNNRRPEIEKILR